MNPFIKQKNQTMKKKSFPLIFQFIILFTFLCIGWVGAGCSNPKTQTPPNQTLSQTNQVPTTEPTMIAIPELLPAIEGYNLWYGVYAMNKKSGFAHMVLENVPEGGYHSLMNMELRIQMMNNEKKLRSKVEETCDSQFRLVTFSSSTEADPVSEEIEGQVENNVLEYTMDHQTYTVELNDNVYSNIATEAMTTLLTEPNQAFEITTFDSGTRSLMMNRIRSGNQEQLMIDGIQTNLGTYYISFKSLESSDWLIQDIPLLVNDQGVPFKISMPPMEFRLEPEELAKSDITSFDIAESPKVTVQNLPESIHELDEATYELVKAPEQYRFPSDAIQQVQNNHIHIIKPELANEWQEMPIEYVGVTSEDEIENSEEEETSESDTPETNIPETIRPYLESNKYIDAEAEEIQQLVSALMTEDSQTLGVITAFADWVHGNLKKDLTPVLLSASSILEEKRGDCKHHAILFAALSRAAGIPCKCVSGLVHSRGMDGFYYHAWNEVYIQGSWVSLDATFNQIPADVTHIKISENDIWDLETAAAIFQLYGKLELRYIQ